MKDMARAAVESLKEMIWGVPDVPICGSDLPENTPELIETVTEDAEDTLPALPMKTPEGLHLFLQTHPELANEYIFRCVKLGVLNNLPEIEFFRLGDTELVATCEQSKYGEQLEMLKTYFVKSEQYEKAGECNKLLDRYHIDQLITGAV